MDSTKSNSTKSIRTKLYQIQPNSIKTQLNQTKPNPNQIISHFCKQNSVLIESPNAADTLESKVQNPKPLIGWIWLEIWEIQFEFNLKHFFKLLILEADQISWPGREITSGAYIKWFQSNDLPFGRSAFFGLEIELHNGAISLSKTLEANRNFRSIHSMIATWCRSLDWVVYN